MSNQEITLKQAAEAYLEHLAAGGSKPSSVKIYGRALDLAITHFGGERKLNTILVPHVATFFASSLLNKFPGGAPKAQATVKQIRRVFRQCLKYAKQQGWITNNLPVPKGELQHARK